MSSEAYRPRGAYMMRRKPEDFDRPEQLRALAAASGLNETAFVARFGYLGADRRRATGAVSG